MYKLIVVTAKYTNADDTALYFDSYEQAKEYETKLKNAPFNGVECTEIIEVK